MGEFMNRYAIINKKDELSNDIANKLKTELNQFMIYDEHNPELVISVGGDGTMLHSVHHYQYIIDDVCFVGIHTGTLGFLTDYQKEEYMELVNDIKNGKYNIYHRCLLDVKTNKGSFFALNEMRIVNVHRSQVLDVFINGSDFETFRGCGMCVSTASGSTALNKSIGGAVVYSEAGIIQLSEIAGIHHNAYRSLGSSLILDKSHSIRFESNNFKGSVLGIDHLSYSLDDVEYIEVKLSQHSARFVQFKKITLIGRLKRSFLDV